MGKNTKLIHNRRPLSPHLTIYRPQISSILSITHRITGVALFLGNLLLAWWLILGVYASVNINSNFAKWEIFGSWFGQVLIFCWSFALIFHLFNGEKISAKLQEEFEIIWRHLLQYTRHIPETFVLRDYHVDNLMWLSERDDVQRVGLLDFQDATIGSPIYDVVSILQDLRYDVKDEVEDAMIMHYLSNNSKITRKEFLASYSILGAQRNLKIVGFVARKSVKDSNSSYLKLLPRVWRYIDKNLKHPLLFPLKAWLDKVISPQVRKAKVGS